MCGGFVIAYTSVKIDPKTTIFSQLLAHFVYNLGRVSSYILIGIGFGALGGILAFTPTAMGYLYFFIGVLMVLMGLSLMGKIRFLTSIESSLTSFGVVKYLFSTLVRSNSLASFYGLGVLNGFLPCGLVYFFAAQAVATASWFWGGVVMLIFGLSTMPALFSFGYLIGFLKGSGFRKVMIKVAAVLIMAYGIYMSYLGFMATQG